MPQFHPPEGATRAEIDELYREQFPHGLDKARRDFLRSWVERDLNSVFESEAKMQVADDRTVASMHHATVDALRNYQDHGKIPVWIDVTKTRVVMSSERSIRIELPPSLLVWFDEGEAMRFPAFHHDCEKCVFLAHHRDHDHYYCQQSAVGIPTVISRWTNEGSGYHSGIEIAKSIPDHPLKTALVLARERGLVQ